MKSSRNLFVLAVATAALAMSLGACTPAGPPNSSWLAAGCYNSSVVGAPDFAFTGTPNVAGNLTVALDIATLTLSENGSCAGIPLAAPYTFTLVRGSGNLAAGAICAGLGFGNGVGQIQSDYPAFPADAWVCNPPATT
ncbi:MAG: hypothetical protein WCJ04_00365 [Actinomycetes bacterium]